MSAADMRHGAFPSVHFAVAARISFGQHVDPRPFVAAFLQISDLAQMPHAEVLNTFQWVWVRAGFVDYITP